jgi:hypothetical protein
VLPGNALFDRLYTATQWARDGDGAFDAGPLLAMIRAERIDSDPALLESMMRKVGAVEAVWAAKRRSDFDEARRDAERKGRR